MIISYLYGRLCPHQEVWLYSYLIRILHEWFNTEFSTLYCRDIKEAEIAKCADPICMYTYEKGAEIVVDLLFEADKLFVGVTEEEKDK